MSLTQLISIEPPSEYTWHFGAQEAGVGNAVPLPAWQTLLKLSKLPASFSSLVHKKSNVYCSSQGRRKDRKEEGGDATIFVYQLHYRSVNFAFKLFLKVMS